MSVSTQKEGDPKVYLIRRKKVLAVALVVVLLPSTLAFGPCNRRSTLDAAAEAAKDIGGGTRDVIKAVGDAYQAGLITLEQKDSYADLLKKIAQGGQKGVDAIELLHNQGVKDPTAEQSNLLRKIFDDDVVAPFLNLLTEMGKLSDTQSAAIRAAMASVRTAIVLLSNRIGRTDVIKEIQAREVRNA